MFSLRTNHSNAAMHNSSNRDYLMSPISKLPVEVLSSIFLQTRDLELESKPKPSPYFPALDPLNPLNCHATPWILSNVSHRWRAIAETTPSLWRLLNVEITDELDRVLNSSRTKEGVPEIVAQRMIERVKRWIENALPKHDSNYLLSGDGPGLLQVSYRNSGWFIRRWDLLLWESSLFPYAQAIARLDVSAHYNLFPLLDGLKGRVARLEALKFDVQGMNQTYRLRLDAFAGSRLRSVEINGVSRFWETIALPWEQMAECNISETSITDSLNVFSLAPNLERFAVRTVGIKNDGPFADLHAFDAYPNVVLESLRVLEYSRGTGGSWYKCPMVKLVAPNLEKLVVKDREVVYHHVLGMIERSGAKVKHLELNHAYRNDLENIERLITSTFPSLRNLVIDLGCNPSVYRSKSNGILEFLMEKIRPGELGFACLENLQLLVMCRSNPRYNNYNEELLLGLLQGTDAFHRPGLRVELHVYGERSDEYERLGSVLMSSGCAVEEKGRTKGGELLRVFHT